VTGTNGPLAAGRGRLRHDSRLVEPGDVFVVLDGVAPARAEWIAGALERGAAEVWCDPALPGLGAYAGERRVRPIEGFRERIGDLAAEWYGHPSRDLTVVGVTGTNGKTSTVQLLAQAWHALGARPATVGTLGAAVHGEELTLNGYTTPPVTRVHELLAEFRDRGVTHVAMEVSSHALEERRVDGVEFDAVHFSNLTRDHLDYHGTMEHYAAQKAKIYTLRGKDGGMPLAIANLDDEFVRETWSAIGDDRPRVGLSSRGARGAAIRAERLRFLVEGTRFDLVVEDERAEALTSLIGRFNVDNLLVVVAALRHQGVPLEEIAALLPYLRPPHGRMTRIRPDESLPTVVVDAGHTPDAIRQALAALQEYDFARIIVVYGATGDRDPGKRPEMARIVEDAADVVVITDDDVHHEDGDRIVADLLGAMRHPETATVIRDRTSAVEHALRLAGPEDVVLLAGKGHEPYQIVGDEHVPYSDIDTAQRLLSEMLGASR